MGKLCDFCCEQRSIVYCKSDAACLCLSCDRNVHSANSLSRRHMRTLICESCHSHPATTRCIDEGISLCQDCSYSGHPPDSAHKWEMINFYSECPSAAEFSRIWSFFSVDQSRWNLEEGEKGGQECQLQENKLSVEEKEEDDAGMDILASDVCERIHETGSSHTLSPKACSPRIEQHEPVHDVIDRDFNTSDIDLGFENYDSLFEDAERLFENGGINSLFEIENSRVDECDFELVQGVKASSAGTETIHPACSNPLSIDDSITSCKSDHNVCSPGPAFSNSFSGLNNECEILDQPECGGVVKDEHPFNNTPSADYQLSSAIRDVALLRYREKKKSRKFDKKIRYASRKVRADVRKRVKGRFVKAGEMYDYDPLDMIRSQ